MKIESPSQGQQHYHYLMLQTGSLPLSPDGTMELSREHRCGSVLLWPEHSHPTAENVILIDPCFTVNGFEEAGHHLKRLNITLGKITHVFITHHHSDHLPNVPHRKKTLDTHDRESFPYPDISFVHCPGHARDLHALTFCSTASESIWVVGDGVLNMEWLRAWGYYWPNQYSSDDIVQTWKSLANILNHADIIIPGHGEQIFVTAPLIEELLATFPSAKYAERCPEVTTILTERLKHFHATKLHEHANTSHQNQ